MMNNNFDVKKMAEIEGIDLGDTSKLSMEQLETISGGSDYADEIINSFGSAFAMLLAAGQIIQTGSCPVCHAPVPTSGDCNDKEAIDIAIAHLQTHMKQH